MPIPPRGSILLYRVDSRISHPSIPGKRSNTMANCQLGSTRCVIKVGEGGVGEAAATYSNYALLEQAVKTLEVFAIAIVQVYAAQIWMCQRELATRGIHPRPIRALRIEVPNRSKAPGPQYADSVLTGPGSHGIAVVPDITHIQASQGGHACGRPPRRPQPPENDL